MGTILAAIGCDIGRPADLAVVRFSGKIMPASGIFKRQAGARGSVKMTRNADAGQRVTILLFLCA